MRSVVQNVSLKNHKKALRYLSNGSSRRFIPSNVKRLPSCMYIDNVIYIIIIIIMKGTKVQTLGARAVAGACWASKRRPHRRPSYLSQAIYVIVSGFNAVEVSQCSLCIFAFSLVFTPYLSNAVVSAKIASLSFMPLWH